MKHHCIKEVTAVLWRPPVVKHSRYSHIALPVPKTTRKFNRWMRNDIDRSPSPLREPASDHLAPPGRKQGDRLPVGMSMSTFQKVTLATCLVLCVGLLLPKMLLSGGRKDAAHGASPFPGSLLDVVAALGII